MGSKKGNNDKERSDAKNLANGEALDERAVTILATDREGLWICKG